MGKIITIDCKESFEWTCSIFSIICKIANIDTPVQGILAIPKRDLLIWISSTFQPNKQIIDVVIHSTWKIY